MAICTVLERNINGSKDFLILPHDSVGPCVLSITLGCLSTIVYLLRNSGV